MQQADILIGQMENGEYVRFGGTEHVALHARTGTGKTSGFSIPNCFAWPGSLIVLDIKREAWKATAGYRSQVLGQDVYLLDPANRFGRSHRWNPAAAISRTAADSYDQISQLAYLLFPESTSHGSGSNSDKFWEPAGRAALTAVAALLAQTAAEDMTIANMLRVFTRGDGQDWLVKQINDRRGAADPYTRQAVDGISDYLNGEAPQVDGIRKTVSTRLAAWHNPRIAAATLASDFNLADIRRKPMTIYIAIAPRDMARMRPFLRLFFDQLINLNTDVTPEDDATLTTPVLLMMDEFVRMGVMSDFAESAQYIRGYGFRVAFIIQSKSQLRALYGEAAAEDIFSNIGAEIVFGASDPKLVKELSERMGDNTVTVTTRNRPRFMAFFNPTKQTEAEHPHRRPLMLAQEIMRMPATHQIMLRPGMLPMRTKRIQWWSDPTFASCVLPPPIVPKLVIDIAFDDGTGPVVRPRAPMEVKVARPAKPAKAAAAAPTTILLTAGTP